VSESATAKRLRLQIERLMEGQKDDGRLRDHLEGLAHDVALPGLTWFWGPALYERNRVVFRSFLLNYFSDWQTDGKSWSRVPWADHAGRVRGLLISLGYGYPVATTLAVLMTESLRQPVDLGGKMVHVPVGPRVCVQGAPTSPGSCNAILLRLDHRLAGLARKHGFGYTRYADDLTLSGDNRAKVKLLMTVASRIVREEGFAINREKTRVLGKGRRQLVTGVVVNQAAGLSRRHRRHLRAAIHQLGRGTQPSDPKHLQRLAGKLAYLHMLNPSQAAPLLARFRSAKGPNR
jgi:hypothetical protein